MQLPSLHPVHYPACWSPVCGGWGGGASAAALVLVAPGWLLVGWRLLEPHSNSPIPTNWPAGLLLLARPAILHQQGVLPHHPQRRHQAEPTGEATPRGGTLARACQGGGGFPVSLARLLPKDCPHPLAPLLPATAASPAPIHPPSCPAIPVASLFPQLRFYSLSPCSASASPPTGSSTSATAWCCLGRLATACPPTAAACSPQRWRWSEVSGVQMTWLNVWKCGWMGGWVGG